MYNLRLNNLKLTSLDISKNPDMNRIYAHSNNLSLKEVYNLSKTMDENGRNPGSNLRIFPQTLSMRQAAVGTKVMLTGDTLVIDGNSTNIWVSHINGNDAEEDKDFTLSGDTLSFLKAGMYSVRLYHEDILHNDRGKGNNFVEIPFAVGGVSAAPNQITFTWVVGEDNNYWPGFELRFAGDKYGFSVDWGDGRTENITNDNTWFSHLYQSAGTYTVTLTSSSPEKIFRYFGVWDYLTSLDVSKAPWLEELYCDDGNNRLTTLDLTHNPRLQYVDLRYNKLTNIVTGITKFEDMDYFNTGRNQLPLSVLHRLSKAMPEDNPGDFRRQILPIRTLLTNAEADLASDMITVGGTPTRFRIWKVEDENDQEYPVYGGNQASADEFTVSGTKIAFHKVGNYQLELFHDSILSQGNRAAVHIPFSVDLSSDATLKSLTVNTAAVTLVAGQFDYIAYVNNEVTSATIAAVANDANATIVSGLGAMALEVGSNNRTIVVRAENGKVQNYVLNVIRRDENPDTNTNLASLSVSVGTLTPAFSAQTTNYTVSVQNNVTEITITAAAEHNLASVVGAGTKSLNVGANTFNLIVTAESGATKTYVVVVNRSDGTSLTDLKEEAAIRVYPNPVADVLHIQTDGLDVPEVRLYNASGRLLMQVRTKELNMSHLPQGLYFVWINGTAPIRVVKR
jgi:hypothetical protein